MQHLEELKTLIKHFNLIKSNKSCSILEQLLFFCFIFLSLCDKKLSHRDKKSKSKIVSLQT